MAENKGIMIVDDTPEHIDMARRILSPLGAPLLACSDGTAAMEIIRRERPTVLLLDIQMPGVTGFDLLEQLREEDFLADGAVLMVTASGREGDIRRGFALGARDYVVKPYRPAELLARVETHLQLVRQQEALRDSYRELEQFCHTVSHDLKAPLQVIDQLARHLAGQPELDGDEQAGEICRRLCAKTDRVIAMVDRLLELSRVTSIEDVMAEVEVGELIDEVFQEQCALYPDRVIDLQRAELPVIEGEPSLLRTLFQNVIGNAVKFTREREEARIEILCRDGAEHLELSIRDNGIGFDMQYAGRILGVFERLHGEEYEGSGVGLAIVDRIMRRHAGSVKIHAEPGIGCEVKLIFQKK